MEVADINSKAKQTNNGIDISAENLAYLDENEPDEDFLRNHINRLEDEILITAIDENGKKKAVGVGYFLDALGNKELKKGDAIYQLSRPSGTDSPYFTDKKTIDMCRGKDGKVDLDKLKKVLQIEDKNNSKTLLTEYILTEDVRLSGGQCVVNFKHGDGSGNQYVLRADSNEARQELKTRIMDTKSKNNTKGDYIMASNSFSQKAEERLKAKKEQEQKRAESRKKALTDGLSSDERRSQELNDNYSESQAWKKQVYNGM